MESVSNIITSLVGLVYRLTSGRNSSPKAWARFDS